MTEQVVASRRVKKSVRAAARKAEKKQNPQATLRNAKGSARKFRLVIDMVRGKGVHDAVRVLHFCDKKAAEAILKLLRSAIANADELGFDVERLVVAKAYVDEGRTMRRWRPRAHGRATRIRKRTSHTTIILGEDAGSGE
jgi:large subunit ribosomal protein L22